MIKEIISNRVGDLKKGLLILPGTSDIFFSSTTLVIYLGTSFVILSVMGSFQRIFVDEGFIPISFLFIVPLFISSFIEEIIFRGLFLPHKSRAISRVKIRYYSIFSIFMFMVWHPAIAFLYFRSTEHLFFDPIFLSIVTLMAIANTITYLRSGSLWIPILIHWVTICIWIFGLKII